MTRRPVVAVVLALLAVSIGLAVTTSRPAAPERTYRRAAPTAPGSVRRRRRVFASPVPVPKPRGLRLRAVLGDGRRAIADHLAATDLTTLGAVLGDPPQERQHRRPARTATSGSPARSAGRSSPRPTTAGRPGRARLHELRDGEERRSSSREAERPRPDDRRSSWRSPRTSASTGSTSTSSSSAIDHVPTYGAFVGRLRTALRAANPDGPGLGRDDRQRARRGDGRRRRRPPAPTGSS